MFQQEDLGYGSGQEPSGYIKLEARDGKARLTAVVQNMKEDANKLAYKIYIIKCTEEQVLPVCAGELKMQRSRGDLSWEFDPLNVEDTRNTINDFNMAAVIVEYKNKKNTEVICPLAAYKDKKVSWREAVNKNLYFDNNVNQVGKNIEKQDVFSKYESKIESKYELPGTKNDSENANKSGDAVLNEIFERQNKGIDGKVGHTEKLKDINMSSFELKTENSNLNPEKAKNSGLETENPGCVMESNSSCKKQLENPGVNSCLNCYEENIKAEVNNGEIESCSIEKLKDSLGKYFKEYDPFGSRRRDYKWWKVSSPVYLNNILYQCSVRTPLLFNPKVMMAHFKYRHLIVGIYSDRLRRRECIVCGVPGAYSIDENPFGEVCRWVQLEGNKAKYGAFGYWLIYIDPKTGKIINLN